MHNSNMYLGVLNWNCLSCMRLCILFHSPSWQMLSSKLSLPPWSPIPIYATELVYCFELYNIYYWKVLLMNLDADLPKLFFSSFWFPHLTLFIRTMSLGSTQPLTEMSTRSISWGVKAAGAWGWRPYHHPVLLSCNPGTLTSWNPLGHSRPVTGLLYLLLFSFIFCPISCCVIFTLALPFFQV